MTDGKIKLASSWVMGTLFVIAISTTCQILFSSLGYTPADDGFILSGARRILWGEIPHKDFITIRPLLPYLIHAPIVYIGGDYTYWLSRFFVLIQFALIAWLWVLIAEKVLNIMFPPLKKIVFAFYSFIYGVYEFPFMAWYSIDAVLVATLGLWFSLQNKSYFKFIGYLLIGLSPLARQNFILVGPILLFLLGDYKKWQYWVASFLPLLLMGFYLLIMGAVPEAVRQLTVHTELFETGFLAYYRNKAFLQGIVVGATGAYFFLARTNAEFKKYSRVQILVGSILLLTGFYYAAYSMLRPDTYYGTGSFLIFGLAVGMSLCLFFEVPPLRSYVRLVAVFAPIAWSVSISIGHNTPGLATGGLVVCLLAFLTTPLKKRNITNRRPQFLALCFLLLPISFIFIYIRRNQIYEERPAGELTYRLDGIYPGGNLIRTNKRTYTYLLDLQQAIKKIGTKQFFILPDTPGYWAAAKQKNPLPIDWPNPGELYTKQLMDRAIAVLKEKRGKAVVILQKVIAVELANKFTPVDYSSTPLLKYVTGNYKKTGETNLFSIYE